MGYRNAQLSIVRFVREQIEATQLLFDVEKNGWLIHQTNIAVLRQARREQNPLTFTTAERKDAARTIIPAGSALHG
jgi:hypothetical protein